METFDKIKDKAKAFIEGFRGKPLKITSAVVILLIIFVIIAFIMLSIQGGKTGEETSADISPEDTMSIPYSAVDEFFPPKQKPLTEDYYFSRERQSRWSEEETDEWFSPPTKADVNKLRESNKKIADDILEAAP